MSSSVEAFKGVRSRRHEKKSRGGCFNCKARKIKCSEVRPGCENCERRGLCCVYPSKAQQRNNRRTAEYNYIPETKPHNDLALACTAGKPFKARDFQYFHHFLTVAYPHLPYNSERAWTSEIPQFAHQFEPLLDAVLSLGASHCALFSSRGEYKTDALIHRGGAIRGLRELASKEDPSNTELDVMLAICYALTLQSACMTDALEDFVTMIRGCALVTKRILMRGYWKPSIPFQFGWEEHFDAMAELLQHEPNLEPELLREGIESLERLGQLLTDETHIKTYKALARVLVGLQRSGLDGYVEIRNIYAVWFQVDEGTFRKFLGSENTMTQMLLVYFVAILVIMLPYTKYEVPERLAMCQVLAVTGKWFDGVYGRLPVESRGLISWPVGVVRSFQLNHQAYGSDVNGLIQGALESVAGKSRKSITMY
ncbi:hypothetical protein FQN57_003552 [Myotisia sp. PD_48]|nr:hypothetical protein FQN57_003552 [Myotisia sp. PD_48]